MNASWNYPTRVRFGEGRASEVPDICKERGIERPLVVTDPGLAGMTMVTGLVEDCRAAGLGVGLFSEVDPNPTGANVDAGLTVMKEGEHDGVVAVGGGSALDAAKAIALMKGQARPLFDFVDEGDNWTRVDESGVVETIALPTTAGTGSEVGRSSVIIDEGDQTKKIIFHPLMLPSVAVCDPKLTVSLPPHLTAATGIDALSHNLEALCAGGYHPMADGIAVEGIRLVYDWLPFAYSEPDNLEARGQMLAASLMGATAFQKGLGAMHALAHPLGARLKAHHGLLNAIVMPYVLRFNEQAIAARLERVARALSLDHFGPSAVIDWVLSLREELGVPQTLEAVGMTEEKVDEIAALAAVDPAGGGNPIPLNEENCAQLLRASLEGDLG
jgi:alcohol dehydrogenase class IV